MRKLRRNIQLTPEEFRLFMYEAAQSGKSFSEVVVSNAKQRVLLLRHLREPALKHGKESGNAL